MNDAAGNNAEWCDLVCRAHGLRTAWTADVWSTGRRTPEFYPDAVTLSPAARAEDVLSGIDTSAGCSIKDSFATLNLVPYGFEVLFEAWWIRRPASPGTRRWRVAGPADLRPWPGAIRPELLTQPGITVLVAESAAAGVIANRSATVVGVSNFFVRTMPTVRAWHEATATIAALYPGLPQVGYERPADLAPALAAGFTTTGPLRVWNKPGRVSPSGGVR